MRYRNHCHHRPRRNEHHAQSTAPSIHPTNQPTNIHSITHRQRAKPNNHTKQPSIQSASQPASNTSSATTTNNTTFFSHNTTNSKTLDYSFDGNGLVNRRALSFITKFYRQLFYGYLNNSGALNSTSKQKC